MKAIVMAGGEGTRLRPLTEGRPKPMTEFFGKPVLEYTVGHLKKYGIRDICFTLRYLPESVRSYFGDGTEFGVNITYSVETAPLGTAGGVKACAGFIGGEDVLIVSGDAVCSFDLDKITDFHKNSGALASIALYETPEPTEYGLVVTDGSGRITRFIEKPAWESVVTDRVNTGIYVLRPEVLDAIPENGSYDFGKDLFPKLLGEKAALYGVKGEGYWCDVGSPEAYRQCCMDVLTGAADIDVGEGRYGAAHLFIGGGCAIMKGAVIRESVIGPSSVVEEDAEVKHSVINGARIKSGASVEDAVVGRAAVIGENARVLSGAVVGDGAIIGAGAVVGRGVRVSCGARVADGERADGDVAAGTDENRPVFEGGGVLAGPYPGRITPETALRIGSILGERGKVGIACTGGAAAVNLADALSCGARASGGEAFMLDCPFEAALSYAAGLYAFDAAAFIRQERGNIKVTIFERGGAPASRALERKTENLRASELERVPAELVGDLSRISGTGRIYLAGTVSVTGRAAPEVSVSVSGAGAENRALRQLLCLMGCRVSEGTGVPSFTVRQGGFELSAADEDGTDIPPERISRLFPECGRDALLLAAKTVSLMHCSGKTLAELTRGLPHIVRTEVHLASDASAAAVMRKMREAALAEFSEELSGGLSARRGDGKVTVTPAKGGRSVVIEGEASSDEDARTLCGELAAQIEKI